jgi:DNA polymerase-3 subunit gamma/tau
LEEPPSHVKFILATTETHKVPETIISRCQRYDFKRISLEDIIDRLKFISEKE